LSAACSLIVIIQIPPIAQRAQQSLGDFLLK
jgi:hypothetical protein